MARLLSRVMVRVAMPLFAALLCGAVLTTPGIVSAAVTAGGQSPAPAANPETYVAVHVKGNHLVNGYGKPVRLIGVDRSGSEYACAEGWGLFDGPSDLASVQAMKTWDVDAVRVPLNEDCWLDINGVAGSPYAGQNYQQAIEGYVATLNAEGIVAILDLHWAAPGNLTADFDPSTPNYDTDSNSTALPMADASHAPTFWSSVASAFIGVPGVVFDLYNEPFGITWSCWLHGCSAAQNRANQQAGAVVGTAPNYATAGMQKLVYAVRHTGATQPIMLGGLAWSSDLTGWLANEPYDKDHQLIASFHTYSFSNCNTQQCWFKTVVPVALRVPVVAGEFGDDDCTPTFDNNFMAFANKWYVSYLAWAWDEGGGWSCNSGPTVVKTYQGAPTAAGAAIKSDFLAVKAGDVGRGGPLPLPTPTLTLPSSTVSIGPVSVGSSSLVTQVGVQNTGLGDLHISSATLSGANASEFSMNASDCTSADVQAASGCSIDVVFTPTSTAAATATIELTDNAAGSPQTITLDGTAQPSSDGPSLVGAGLTTSFAITNSWTGGASNPPGYQASITVTNPTGSSIGSEAAPWVLQFELPDGTSLQVNNGEPNLWAPGNVMTTQTTFGTTLVTVTEAIYPFSLSPGASVTLGYVATGTGKPFGCLIGGTTCSLSTT